MKSSTHFTSTLLGLTIACSTISSAHAFTNPTYEDVPDPVVQTPAVTQAQTPTEQTPIEQTPIEQAPVEQKPIAQKPSQQITQEPVASGKRRVQSPYEPNRQVHREHLAYLDKVLSWIEKQDLASAPRSELSRLWQDLTSREQKLRDWFDSFDGDISHADSPNIDEHAFTLFALNNLDPSYAERLKRVTGMPASTILTDEYRSIFSTSKDTPSLHNLPIAGILDKEGNLYNATMYSQLDPGWTLSLAYYLAYKTGFIKKAPMDSPTIVDLSDLDDVSVLVIGDWGTGYWDDSSQPSPAELVMNSAREHPAMIGIHLGDEYYAGTQKTLDGRPGEEATNFTYLWDPGTPYSFSLGSNHSMYDAELGMRYITLESDKFEAQGQTTTFAIELKNWILVGLDTARNDPSTLFQDGAIDPDQGSFLRSIAKKGKKVLLFTHHNGISFDGKSLNDPLWSQIEHYLGRAPEYWIWGHIHQGIAYSSDSAAGDTVARVWGHGAIPVGSASELFQSDGSLLPEISYYSRTPYPNPSEEQKLRIRNGFGLLHISGDEVQEQMFDQYGELQWQDTQEFPPNP